MVDAKGAGRLEGQQKLGSAKGTEGKGQIPSTPC